MLGKVYLKTEEMIRAMEAENKSEVAVKIGITPGEFYSFFAGNRVQKADTLKSIADYFSLTFDQVKKEHEDNIQAYMKKKLK